MKYLNGIEAQKGDAVVTITPDGFAVAGTVHELYERNMTVRVTGYALQIPASKVVLAKDAYDAVKAAKAPEPVAAE